MIYKFVTAVEQINDSKSNYESNCIDITFWNKGGQTIVVSGVPVATGESLSINGTNSNEINVTVYQVAFSGSGTKDAYIIRKIYVN